MAADLTNFPTSANAVSTMAVGGDVGIVPPSVMAGAIRNLSQNKDIEKINPDLLSDAIASDRSGVFDANMPPPKAPDGRSR